jgi:hypothetical protein
MLETGGRLPTGEALREAVHFVNHTTGFQAQTLEIFGIFADQ